MNEPTTPSPADIEAAILGSASPGPSTDPTADATRTAGAASEVPTHGTFDPAPTAARTEERFTYIYPERGKKYRAHMDAIAAGKDPRELEHIRHGRWRGCQCLQCKTVRNEVLREVVSVSDAAGDPGPADPLVADLLTAELIGHCLALPNKFMQTRLKMSKAPAAAVAVFDTDADEMATYQKYGKRLADHYLTLPNVRHKELILFGFNYFATFGMKLATLRAMMPTEPQQEKPADG